MALAAQPLRLEWIEAVAILGIPVGATLGAIFSREAVTTVRPGVFVLKLGLIALVVPAGVLVLMPLALPFVLLLGPVATLSSGAVFTFLMRRLAVLSPHVAVAISSALAVGGLAVIAGLSPHS